MHITALGEILIDYTPLQTDCSDRPVFEQNPGGAPANVLACAAKLGRQTAFLGKVGDDLQGRFLMDCLKDAGIDTRGVVVDADSFTTLAFVTLSETGERSFAFACKPGADTRLWSAEVDVERLRQTDIFHIGSLSLTDEPARSATRYAILAAKQSGAIISYDPNYRPLLWPDEAAAAAQMRSVLPDVDIVKCSDEETLLLTGMADPEAAARHLVEGGISCAVVTLGADGALAATREGVRHVPGFASRVVDTTGAGDSFWGGVLTCLSESGLRPETVSLDQLAEFVRFGNAVASLCVEQRGAIPAMPAREQVLARLAQHM